VVEEPKRRVTTTIDLDDLVDSSLEDSEEFKLQKIHSNHETRKKNRPSNTTINGFDSILTSKKKIVWHHLSDSDSDSLLSEPNHQRLNDFDRFRAKYTHQPSFSVKSLHQEEDAIDRAKRFLRKNRQDIRKRQSDLLHAEEEWRQDSVNKDVQVSPQATRLLQKVRRKLDKEEEEIGSAISQMIEGQSYVNQKERHLRLMEKTLQNSHIDPLLPSDDETEDELRYKIRRLRELQSVRGGRYAHDDDPEYEPWIERVVGSRYDKHTEDRLPTKHSAGDEPRRSRSVDDILTEGRRDRQQQRPFYVPPPKPNVEERLESKWKEYFGDRLQPTYDPPQRTQSAWGYDSAMESLRHSANVMKGTPSHGSTEKRLQSHTEWLRSVKKEREKDLLLPTSSFMSSSWKPDQSRGLVTNQSMGRYSPRFEVGNSMDIRFVT